MCFFTISISRKPQLKRLLSEVYGDERTCRVWFKCFRNDDVDVKERMSKIAEKIENFNLQELLDENPRKSANAFRVVESVKCYSKGRLKTLVSHGKAS